MKDRTLQILNALIEDFIETASPVASKHLLVSGEFDISSATVRNEFAILEEIGLIESPHISAGKVPTQKGYRFFVNELLRNKEEELEVQTLFEKHLKEYRFWKSKETIFDMLKLLAHLSENVAFTSIENDTTAYLGISNVLRCPEFIHEPEKAAQIVEILEGQDRFQTMLHSLNMKNQEIKIFIGTENMVEEISSCSMIVARFQSQNIKGYMGILGPMRMKYGFNKALLSNVLEMLS